MSLREAFDSVPQRRGGRPCGTCVALSVMPEDDAETLLELLASEASTAVISEACKRAGYPQLTEGTLKRHRRAECRGLT
jgi:hypothetical protein